MSARPVAWLSTSDSNVHSTSWLVISFPNGQICFLARMFRTFASFHTSNRLKSLIPRRTQRAGSFTC